jgi:hypothetical protein
LLLCFFRHGDLRVLRWVVLEGRYIKTVFDVLAVTFVALVEAGAGLAAEKVLIEHLPQLGVRFELFARLVRGGSLVEVLSDADGDV